MHGLEAKLAVQNCTDCHGADLSGSGDATSCDACHQEDWRTTCTYCHGGMDNQTGAPPQDIDDGTTDLAFGSHTAHVEASSNHSAFACSDCHQVPTDVLSDGHLWDGTAGQAEVDMSAGLSSSGTWTSGSMSCANLYCHGDGQGDNGSVTASESMSCGSCHGSSSNLSSWSTMSGEHSRHLSGGLSCSDCHGDVVSDSSTVADASLHVDGSVEWAPGESTLVVGSDGSCTGFCHWQGHWFQTW
ncbi:MAG: hypothetical protein GXP62_12815 [Oligoflexia bacterium]|nr:hypothetical protein [Oligoflexia bacterium]